MILRELQKLALKASVFAHNWRQDVMATVGTTLHSGFVKDMKCGTVPVMQCHISHRAMSHTLFASLMTGEVLEAARDEIAAQEYQAISVSVEHQ